MMMSCEPGEMRHLAIYQEPTRTIDAYNNETISGHIDHLPVRCKIEDLKAWELVKYRAVQMNVTHRIIALLLADQRRRPAGLSRPGFRHLRREQHGGAQRRLVILANEVVKPKAGS